MNLKKSIDKIVYPFENGTHKWYKTNRYDIVCGDTTFYIYNWDVIRLLEILINLEEEEK